MMKIPVLICLAFCCLYLISCKDCDQNETSNSSIQLEMDTALTIDSIAFRGTTEVIRPKSKKAAITINPHADVCYYDIYINGTHKFLGLVYKRKMIYDCAGYFIEYQIDSLVHDFSYATYQPASYGNSSIRLK